MHKVLFRVETDETVELVLWVGLDGEIIKAQVGADEVPEQMAQSMVETMLPAIFAPFMWATDLDPGEMLAAASGPGWSTEVVKREQRSFVRIR